ncbi:hypothetical protein AB0I49_21790 [Streptomyces sp. NPDC050617]|uniref:hypothetical protein n=1 Tax=Streptomyces sp. NPDC050617 TaxID=3154628 RepID=UPI003445C3EC
MAESSDHQTLAVPEDLTRRFTEIGQISHITDNLTNLTAQLTEESRTAGGKDDEWAKKYHEYVDKHCEGLTQGVKALTEFISALHKGGTAAAGSLNQAEDDATQLANHLTQR